jgi:hypothetical protein
MERLELLERSVTLNDLNEAKRLNGWNDLNTFAHLVRGR